MILATWLSQAAGEEQTSVLHVILKVHMWFLTFICYLVYSLNLGQDLICHFQVLCHLPLHKAQPVHMSAILQSVNRLRFYKSPGVFLSACLYILSNLYIVHRFVPSKM